jgi:hypothetical protein
MVGGESERAGSPIVMLDVYGSKLARFDRQEYYY